jgi:hypothetical protein
MADDAIITWNGPNMITIPLMALVGFMLIGLIAQMYHNSIGSGVSVVNNAS